MLRKKIIAFGGGILLLSVLLIYTSLYPTIISAIRDIENRDVIDEAFEAYEIVKNQIEVLNKYCADWAEWDDSYQFVIDRNEEYISSNLVNETFTTFKLNYIIYLDRQGNIVFAKGYDFDKEEVIPIPETLKEHLERLRARNDSDVKKGIVMLERPLMFSSRPILTSEERGPYRGTLVFARYIDEEFVEQVSSLLKKEVSFSTELTEKPKTVILNESTIKGIVPVKDIYGNNILSLELKTSRDAYILGKSYINTILISASIIGAVMIFSSILIIDRAIIRRILRVTNTLNRIIEKKELHHRIDAKGDDEIAILERRINELLDEIQKRIYEIEWLNDNLRLVNKITRHDIINDLNVILLSIEAMKEGKNYNEEYISASIKAIRRIEELIDRMREFEKISHAGIEPKEVDIKKVIENILDKYPVDIEIRGSCKVLADETIISIFDNLIRNSIEHGNATKITIEIKKSEGYCDIRVSDNGKGIPEEVKEKIFNEGFTTGDRDNTGLGLYIAKKLVERYGGDIKLESTRPATFRISLKSL